ncbi:MAG: 2-oxoglutarate dehydrogenase E1 component [Gammaproteobacteria bacterium]|nr:2-oxoglutarate dehydrogenase E1 component [Gammaproteobacteria bacterium]MDE0511980.1 2-oxoglutarate dehydrogenase E1 component [Gammaproteobacteria bacterium]
MSNTDPSHFFSGNTAFVEDVYERYLEDPASVSVEWRQYFDALQREPAQSDGAGSAKAEEPARAAETTQAPPPEPTIAVNTDNKKQASVLQLINAHRFRGHQQADLDPLKQYERPEVPELDPAYYNFTEEDLTRIFNTGSLFAPDELTLAEIFYIVKSTYCRTIGAEYMHINETEQKRWIQRRMEESEGHHRFSQEKRKRILERVIAANALEEYLHRKYVGQKRFSLEGGEALIPLLDELVQAGGEAGVREAVIGMAHRGRLNVLINIIGKLPGELFDEFEGSSQQADDIESTSSGDVKYHLGYSSDIHTPGGPIHLTLSFNPSHLEIIDPVVEGSVRARQDRRQDKTRSQVLPIIIHGDAAFAGQGVVMETFNLSQTRGYSTGGTVHIIVNNQIGFTTSDPLDSRSTLYCTDVAKMVQAPIFHVNGDDPDAVVYVAKLALDYRMEFKKDVVIDMVCYRRHGHSEADEPAATQPIMYRKIRQHRNIREIHSERLVKENVVTQDEVRTIHESYLESLESNRSVAGARASNADFRFLINYEPFKKTAWNMWVETAVSPLLVSRMTERFTSVPEHFTLHPSVVKIIENRKRMGAGELDMDWGYAETLAYATLLDAGFPVRISGQDSGRGTFFHRHAVIHNQDDGDTYLPLQNLNDGQPSFLAINSTLSEEAVLAFDYGYASAEPNALVIWEAQFGDFANGAQVVFDQFISSCEAKWGRFCGLTVFLPHGYDGQGPEHSSARLERFLQLCARENMQVCQPSTPAQMFHLLRRQVIRPYRKPLIVMSPKSLLRHKLSTSTLDKVTSGGLQLVIDEIDENIEKNAVTRLLICSGKVYYDLLEARRGNEAGNIAIIRLEQLFPFPQKEMKRLIDSYPNANEIVWVQEEPKNQGGWYFMQSRGTLVGCLSARHVFGYAGRIYSASPAAGSLSVHLAKQKKLVDDALQLEKLEVTTHKQKTSGIR